MDGLDNSLENIDVIEPTINVEATLAKRLNLADFINESSGLINLPEFLKYW